MPTKRLRGLFALLAVVTMLAAACASEEPAPGDDGTDAASPTDGDAEPTDDLLARIQQDGIIRVATDPAYPPQSFLNEETDEYEGFDIDVATEIANRLGVEVQWETPSWNAITAGGWSDRWDMSVGSMTVTAERAEVLDFAPAYYFTPASVAVHVDNTSIQDLETDLDGKRIGVCGACTYDFFLQRTLDIPGYTFNYIIDDPQIQTYDTDTTVIQDLALGDGVRLDAMISAKPTIEGAIERGRTIKIVGDPVFAEPLAPAFDKSSALDNTRLVDEVSRIIEEMHEDGTLSSLSMTWYDEDLTIGA
jgi:polar amino acid transport system substrate-binding protein